MTKSVRSISIPGATLDRLKARADRTGGPIAWIVEDAIAQVFEMPDLARSALIERVRKRTSTHISGASLLRVGARLVALTGCTFRRAAEQLQSMTGERVRLGGIGAVHRKLYGKKRHRGSGGDGSEAQIATTPAQ